MPCVEYWSSPPHSKHFCQYCKHAEIFITAFPCSECYGDVHDPFRSNSGEGQRVNKRCHWEPLIPKQTELGNIF